MRITTWGIKQSSLAFHIRVVLWLANVLSWLQGAIMYIPNKVEHGLSRLEIRLLVWASRQGDDGSL